MRSFLISNLLILIFLAMPASSPSKEPPKDVCYDSRTLTIGFFNGVGNTHGEAEDNLDALGELLSLQPEELCPKPKRYELFYNRTKGLERDIFETIAQKYMEEKLSDNEIFSFGELFWYIRQADMGIAQELTPGELGEAINEIIKNSASLDEFIKSITGPLNTLLQERFKLMITQAYNGELQSDYMIHKDKLAEMLEQNHKFILVAHSQGNLFANRVYEKVVHNKDALYPGMDNFVKIVHVAPPTDVLYGPYILNSMDHVINFVGRFFTVPPPNIYLGILSNHSFIGTYLRQGYDGSWEKMNHMISTIAWSMFTAYDHSNISLDARTRYLDGVGVIGIWYIITDPNGRQWGESSRNTIFGCDNRPLYEGVYHIKALKECYSNYSDSIQQNPPIKTFDTRISVHNRDETVFFIDKIYKVPYIWCEDYITTETIDLFSITISASRGTDYKVNMSAKDESR